MKKILRLCLMAFLLISSVALPPSVLAQSNNPSRQIQEGRKNLAKQTSEGILAAHTNFSNALRAAPNNAEANLLSSITLFLSEHADRALHNEVQAVGIGVIDPNPYNTEFSYPVDRLGRFAPFRHAGTRRSLDYLFSKETLHAQALARLRKITDTNFRTKLSEKETSLLAVTIDHADVRLLRAILQIALAGVDMARVYNLEAEYFWIYRRAVTPGLTPEMVSRAYPAAFDFTGQTSKRLSARIRLIEANSEIQAALAFMKTRQPANPPNLFEMDSNADSADLAAVCAALARSLIEVTSLPDLKDAENPLEGRKLDLSKLIDSPNAPRTWFPDKFDRGFVQQGAWKDPTMGDVFPDATVDDLDEASLGLGILQNTVLEPYRFTTLSGRPGLKGYLGQNGVALYGDIQGLCVDAAGNVYVADGQNHVIRKIAPDGEVSDVVGKRWEHHWEVDKLWNEHFSQPVDPDKPSGIFYTFGGGLAFDSAGNLFFTADGLLYKFTTAGELIHFAGSWEGQPRNGTGKNARFTWPTQIAIGSNGVVYVCDKNAIRRVASNARVTTLAGRLGWYWNGAEGYRNGNSRVSLFDSLQGLTMDPSGSIFVTDGDNGVVRKITPQGMTTTFAGLPGSREIVFDSSAKKARMNHLGQIASDARGNLFFSDGELVRKITPQGKVTTIGGKYRNPGRRDGAGEGALFGKPATAAIAVDSAGRVYVADETTVRRGARVVPKKQSKK
jgi:streptogramin lyase